MDGIEKTALFLSGLDFSAVDQVLSRLDSATARQVRHTMISFKQQSTSEKQAEQIDREFLHSAGWQPHEREVHITYPQPTARAPHRQPPQSVPVSPPVRYGTEAFVPAAPPFAFLRDWSAADIMAVMVGEPPQILAVILAHLPKSKMNAVLSALPTGLHSEIVDRLRTLEMPEEFVLREIETALRNRTTETGASRRSDYYAPATEPAYSAAIEMFEDLEMLTNAELSTLFHSIDLRQGMLSLIGGKPSFVNRVIQRFSPTEEAEMRRYLKQLRSVDTEDIEQAQENILELYRNLFGGREKA